MTRRLARTALLLALATAAPAHAQVSLGRLFATPDERAAMEAARGGTGAPPPNAGGQQVPPGMPGTPESPGQPPASAGAAAPALTMSGVLRRSDSRNTTVWLNDLPQASSAAADVIVTLPSGKKIKLKPGQRYDMNQGRVKDVNEP